MRIRIRISLLAAVHDVTASHCSCIELSYLLSSPPIRFQNLRFHFAENGIKLLRPHDRLLVVLPARTKIVKATEHRFNLLLHMCRRRYLNLQA